MKKLFIVRLFTILMLIFPVVLPGYANNNKKIAAMHKAVSQTVPVTKAAPLQAKPVPAFRPHLRKPTAEDTILMRDKSLNGQYKYLLVKTYRFQEPFIADFYRNLRDTINADRSKLKETETKLAAQTKTIGDLQAGVTQKDKSLAQSNTRINAIDLFGIYIDKSAYNLIMWGLVLLFGITAAVVIVRSASFSREAKYRITLYNELDEEYKAYKAKANDKEKKLARELQTERNKLDELMGRS
jgi:hypothetical protein